MKYIMLSRFFPVTHPRKGEPTGFVEKILTGKKIHTIRANAKKRYCDGDEVSLRYWSGKPYGSTQVEFHRCRIGIDPVWMPERDAMGVFVANQIKSQFFLAKNDGLSLTDFLDWFWPRGRWSRRFFTGDIIHFTDFRYGAETKVPRLQPGRSRNQRR